MLLTDLHIHSTFSDGKMTIPQVVDFYGTRGFDCIAITDHICERRTIWGRTAHSLKYTLTPSSFPLYMEIIKSEAKRAMHRYGMLLLPGFELSKNSFSNHRSAHILGIGVSEFVSADLSIEDQLGALRAQGALTIAAHPVNTRRAEKQTYHLWDNRETLKTYFDAWEVASGPHLFAEVKASGLPVVANSDLHRPDQIVSWKTKVRAHLNAESVFAAIRRQDIELYFYEEEILDDSRVRARHAHHLDVSPLSALARNTKSPFALS